MKLNPKVTGVVATIVLTLIMPASVMAQQTDAQDVDVTLANQLCGIDISLAGGTGFGTWQWDGTGYTSDSGPIVVMFNADFLTAPFGGCTVTVDFAGLGVTSSTVAIDPSHFTAVAEEIQKEPAHWTETSSTSTDFTFRYILNSVPETLEPGNYRGSIVASVANVV